MVGLSSWPAKALVFSFRVEIVEGGDAPYNVLAVQICKVISVHTNRETTSRSQLVLTIVHNSSVVQAF
jgi:hypothetical protein